MAERDTQFITISRQGIIVAMAMAIGLLTLCFVIGVQVGKKSLTQKNVRIKTLDEELKELPEPLSVQLELFQAIGADGEAGRNDRQRPIPPAADSPRPVAAIETPRPAAETARPGATETQVPTATDAIRPTVAAAPTPVNGDRWTAQVAALSDIARANAISDQLKSRNLPTKIVFADGLYKVQLDLSSSRAEIDSYISRLQIMGYEAMAIRVY